MASLLHGGLQAVASVRRPSAQVVSTGGRVSASSDISCGTKFCRQVCCSIGFVNRVCASGGGVCFGKGVIHLVRGLTLTSGVGGMLNIIHRCFSSAVSSSFRTSSACGSEYSSAVAESSAARAYSYLSSHFVMTRIILIHRMVLRLLILLWCMSPHVLFLLMACFHPLCHFYLRRAASPYYGSSSVVAAAASSSSSSSSSYDAAPRFFFFSCCTHLFFFFGNAFFLGWCAFYILRCTRCALFQSPNRYLDPCSRCAAGDILKHMMCPCCLCVRIVSGGRSYAWVG